jgi:hypothetical protein
MYRFQILLRWSLILLVVAGLVTGIVFAVIEAVKEDDRHVKHCQSIGGWVSRKDIITPIYGVSQKGYPTVSYVAVTESYCWTKAGLRDNW